MKKNIINFFFILPLFIIFSFSISYYISEKNIIATNKSRSAYSLLLIQQSDNLQILKSDTDNIIVYKDDIAEYEKLKKPRIWEKLISDESK
tara:strand:- start:4772 stop:5044 length:273 start_codon:yes stop_codon:yes gene_type:complete